LYKKNNSRIFFPRTCYSKLNLLLLAIETTNENGQGSSLSINPGTYKCIESGTRGFFIAGSIEEIKR
jgi:hypothetical protein